MGVSKLKIPKICEHCGNPFEAKTLTTRFCSPACGNKSGKEKKKQAQEVERKQTLLEQSAAKIAEMQTRPFLSISEATIMFGISKDTIRRLIIPFIIDDNHKQFYYRGLKEFANLQGYLMDTCLSAQDT